MQPLIFGRMLKVRRPNQRKRQAYRKHSSASTCTSSGTDEKFPSETCNSTDSDTDTCILDDWDNWMYTDDSDFD